MQITFANSLNPDQDQQNVDPDLGPNCSQRSSADDKSHRYIARKELNMHPLFRFTELFVDELEDSQDLKVLVSDYLQGLSLSSGQVDGIVKFYLLVRNEAVKKLTDGTSHQPHFSLRTLCRALRFAALNSCGSVPRSLYEVSFSFFNSLLTIFICKQFLSGQTKFVSDLDPSCLKL